MLLATVSLAVASDYFQKLTADGKSVCNHRAFILCFLNVYKKYCVKCSVASGTITEGQDFTMMLKIHPYKTLCSKNCLLLYLNVFCHGLSVISKN